MLFRMIKGALLRQWSKMLLIALTIALGASLATSMINVMLDVGDKVNEELKAYGANIVVKPKDSTLLSEIYSVEDEGEGICFNVFVYNAQPGIEIDYSTGESRLNESDSEVSRTEQANTYVLNTNSKKFHNPDCSSVSKISENNKQVFEGTREELIDDGYSPCGICKP